MTAVRATGVTASHLVRGVGHHDHTEYLTDDGTRVVVAEFRGRDDPLRVTWWDADGDRHEVQARADTHRFALACAGFTLT